MPNINLLPKELAPDSALLTSSSLLRKMTIVGTVLLLVSVIVMVIYHFTLSSQVKNSLSQQEEYKEGILALETVEQRLVLAKDRAVKLGAITSDDKFGNELVNLKSLLSRVTIANINEISLSGEKTEITLSAGNSKSLVETMATLISLENYKRVDLVSFNYNTSLGFSISLIFLN